MKNIIKIWILLSIVMFAFTQGSVHENMGINMDKQPSSCHGKKVNIQTNGTCDYVCSLVFLHKNEISLNVLSFTSLNIAFSNTLSNLNLFKPFKPPIYIL